MKKIKWHFLINAISFLNITMMLAEEGGSNSEKKSYSISKVD